MIGTKFNRYNFLRIAVSMLLVFFIGCKVVTPLFLFSKSVQKEASVNTAESDNDEEKKADPSPKEKEFASIYSNTNVQHLMADIILHLTVYSNNYQASHYQTITIPPPDRA